MRNVSFAKEANFQAAFQESDTLDAQQGTIENSVESGLRTGVQ